MLLLSVSACLTHGCTVRQYTISDQKPIRMYKVQSHCQSHQSHLSRNHDLRSLNPASTISYLPVNPHDTERSCNKFPYLEEYVQQCSASKTWFITQRLSLRK